MWVYSLKAVLHITTTAPIPTTPTHGIQLHPIPKLPAPALTAGWGAVPVAFALLVLFVLLVVFALDELDEGVCVGWGDWKEW